MFHPSFAALPAKLSGHASYVRGALCGPTPMLMRRSANACRLCVEEGYLLTDVRHPIRDRTRTQLHEEREDEGKSSGCTHRLSVHVENLRKVLFHELSLFPDGERESWTYLVEIHRTELLNEIEAETAAESGDESREDHSVCEHPKVRHVSAVRRVSNRSWYLRASIYEKPRKAHVMGPLVCSLPEVILDSSR